MSLPLIARRLLHLLGLTQSIFNKPTASPVRQATPADLNAVVEVVLSTMPQDPQWNYRFPYRDKYPEDHLKYTSMLFEYFIDPSYDDWLVMVVDAPDIKNPKVSKIVAFSIWDVSYINKAKYGPSYQPQNPMAEVAKRGGATRRDANPARVAAFREAGSNAKNKYFTDVYGDQHLHLQILGTHPDYMRRGHGTSLCQWGMAKAKDDRIPFTLIASPMGILLYTHLGFKDVGEGVIQVPGEEEKVYWHAMEIEPAKASLKVEDVECFATSPIPSLPGDERLHTLVVAVA